MSEHHKKQMTEILHTTKKHKDINKMSFSDTSKSFPGVPTLSPRNHVHILLNCFFPYYDLLENVITSWIFRNVFSKCRDRYLFVPHASRRDAVGMGGWMMQISTGLRHRRLGFTS